MFTKLDKLLPPFLKSLFWLSVVLISSVLCKPGPALADSSVIFSDGFESDDFGSWASAGNKWKTIKNASNAYSGQYRAEVKGNTSGDSVLLAEEPSSGHEDIKLKFWHKISQKLESDDHVFVEWSEDGDAWNQLTDFSSVSAGDWSKNEFPLSQDADDKAGFRFRFRADLNGGSDVFWLDDVELTGNLIPASPSLAPLASGSSPPSGLIMGYKWHDLNRDGIWQKTGPAEPPLADWAVALGKASFSLPASASSDPIPIEIVAFSLTDSSGSFSFSAVSSGDYKIFEEKKPLWLITSPASRSDSLFDISYSVDTASRQFDLNSFFDVSVEFNGQTEIDTDSASRSLAFGNVQYAEFLGAKVFSLNGSLASASEAVFIGDSTFSISASAGLSSIIISDDTTASRSDGGTFDVSQLTLGSVDFSLISGLDTGTVVDGALQWGLPSASLEFSQPITLNIFAGPEFNGQTLNIVRSLSSGGGWTNDGIGPPSTCVVADGFCGFTATKASYFTVFHAVPSSSDSGGETGDNSGGGGGGGGGAVGGSSIFTPTPLPSPLAKEEIQLSPPVSPSPPVLNSFPSLSPIQLVFQPSSVSSSAKLEPSATPSQDFLSGAIGELFSGVNILIAVVGFIALFFFLKLNKKSSKES